MSILDFPDAAPDGAQWALAPRTQRHEGELDGTVQTSGLPGTKWRATLTYGRRKGAKARLLRGFLVALDGEAGRFRLFPHDARTPAGTALGAPVVSGAGQTGGTLTVAGFTPNQPGALLAGDYFQIGSELKMLTADADVDAGGAATLTFKPALRSSPAAGAAIVTTDPCAVMKLVDDNQAAWAASTPDWYALAISCEEALDL